MQFLSTWTLVTATTIPHFTLSVQYNGWLYQWCAIGTIDNVAYQLVLVGHLELQFKRYIIFLRIIWLCFTGILDSVWSMVRVNMNCFHVWPDNIIGSVLVVYHLCIFEYVLSVASCDTTLNMESMKLVIFEHW